MTLLQSGIAKPSSGYDIDQSLRFDDGDSAYMTRTPSSAGNQKTWTYSGWIKKGNDVTEQLFTTDVGTTSTTYGSIALHSSGYFYVGEYSQNFRQTTQLFRDPSAWYHFVVAFDTTESTGSNRVKVYVNGEQITDFSTSNDPTQDADYAWNNTNRHDIGSEKGTGNFFDGYMAEVHFIDGQALTPASFGETNSATNQWVPIEVTGMTYGTNGLYLPFSSTELADSFTDSSKSAVDSSDRESEIAVTSSFTWLFTSSGNTDGEDLVNGLVTNNDAGGGWMPSGDVTDRWIKFDFGSGKVYTKCQWISINSTGSEGTWKWQGSNNDSDWTDIGGTFTLGGADGGSNVTYTLGDTLSGNTTSYRYYRILGTTGSANTSGRRLAMYFGGWSDGIGHTITANGDVANVRTPFYKSESFTTVESTTWTAPAGITSVEYLVVAGGGEGGWDAGGGGGAGGYRTGTLSVTPGASYTVTVGAGGTSTQSGSSKYGADGDNSVFSSITSTGGGGGGSTSSSISGRAGGSGGGGGGYNASGGSGGAGNAGSFSPVEGNVGGAGASGATTAGGGGGGSSSAGATGGSPTSAGGDGTSNSITGSAVTYAAGGQGNSDSSGSNTSGAANTGNGGNGGAGTPQGGAGGSGIVVIKYLDPDHPIESSSIKFDGTADYLSSPDSADWDVFGSSSDNWTIDFFVKHTDHAGSETYLSQSEDSSNYWQLAHYHSGGLWFGVKSGGSWIIDSTAGGYGPEITDTNWHHVALCKVGQEYGIYLDGAQGDYISDSSTDTFSALLAIGTSTWDGTNRDFDGYMDEIRIQSSNVFSASPNVGKTDTITVPTSAHTADANTKLLIHSDFNGGIGADSSGNKNDFTPTNLVATDQVLDSPSRNYCTLNPLDKDTFSGYSLTEGNLEMKGSAASDTGRIRSTFNIDSGKWYWEVNLLDVSSSALNVNTEVQDISYAVTRNAGDTGGYNRNWASSADNGIVMVAFNADIGALWYGYNGTWDGSATSSEIAAGTTTNANFSSMPTTATYAYRYVDQAGGSGASRATHNFGQDSSFAGNKTAQGNGGDGEDFYYTPPTGYKALNTDNLDDPAIALPGDFFNTVLYSGNGGTQSVTGAGFAPDFVWIKNRTDAVNHGLFDTVRGVRNSLQSNTTTEARTAAGATEDLYAFGSDGFSVGVDTGGTSYINCNESSKNYTSWNWKAGGAPTADNSAGAGATPTAGSVKIDGANLGSALAGSIAATRLSANTTAGFSIVSYTGTGSTATVAHGLSSVELLIVKNRTTGSTAWQVGSDYLPNANPWSRYITLSSDAAETNSTQMWNDTPPTSSVFTIKDAGDVNTNTNNYIAYCFNSIEGYSKVGSYEGNANADGTFVYTGFQVSYLLTKSVDGVYDWYQTDNKSTPINVRNNVLYPNLNVAHGASWPWVDFLSNGFKLRTSSSGVNNNTFIYLAYSSSPFKTSNGV